MHIKLSALNRAQGRALWHELLQITQYYWSDHRFDNQYSFGKIKPDLRRFDKQLSELSNAIDDLHNLSRMELNGDRSLSDRGHRRVDHVGNLQSDIERLREAAINVCLPNYVKVGSIAVPNCLNKLELLYEKATNRKFSRTEDTEISGSRIVFIKPGPRCLHDIINAIDPNVGFKKVYTWLKKPRQAGATKK